MRYLPISQIVVHHSAGGTWESIRAHHKKKGWGDNTAYHWGITKAGDIQAGRDEVKDSTAGTRNYWSNQKAIAICVLGNFETEQPTENQLNTLKKMIQHKMKIYGIKPENVVGHRDCSSSLCPGKNLYSKLKSMTFTPPEWSEKAIRWAAQEKIITKITGESVEDYRLAVILHNFERKIVDPLRNEIARLRAEK